MDRLIHLKLHETIDITANLAVLRVPNGWIYTSYYGDRSSSTFVPEMPEVTNKHNTGPL